MKIQPKYVKVALAVLEKVAANEAVDPDTRIRAALGILGYASTPPPTGGEPSKPQ